MRGTYRLRDACVGGAYGYNPPQYKAPSGRRAGLLVPSVVPFPEAV